MRQCTGLDEPRRGVEAAGGGVISPDFGPAERQATVSHPRQSAVKEAAGDALLAVAGIDRQRIQTAPAGVAVRCHQQATGAREITRNQPQGTRILQQSAYLAAVEYALIFTKTTTLEGNEALEIVDGAAP